MIYKNKNLSKYNWFNLGGPAKILFKANSEEDLKFFLQSNIKDKKNVFNLLKRDEIENKKTISFI